MNIKIYTYKLLFGILDMLSNIRPLHKLVINRKVYLGASIITFSLANNSCSDNKTKDTVKTLKDTVQDNKSIEETDSSNQPFKNQRGISTPNTSPNRKKSIIHVASCYINLEIDNKQEETPAISETDSTIYTIADEDPQFIGGNDSLLRYINTNIKYFPSSCYVSIEGTVYVNFVITKTGELADIKVIRGLSPAQDEEALRLVKSMPKWNPGKHQGKTVNSYFTLPIRFKLQ